MSLIFQLFIILLLFLSLFFFTCGVRQSIPKLRFPEIALGAVFGLGILTLLHLATILTVFGMPGVWVGEALFSIFVILGLKPGWRILSAIPEKWQGAEGRDKLIWGSALYYLVFWLYMLRDNISLPSYHDGIAHLSWFIDVHRSGHAFLSKIPLSFSEFFGLSQRNFYPTGMQAVIAMISGYLMRLGVGPTLILKSVQIFSHLCLLVTLLWGVRKHWPKIPAYLLWIAALVSTAAFRFPMDASAEGGLSRLVAFAVVFPLVLCLGSGRIFGLKEMATITGLSLLPAFLLHPSVFWILALSLAHASFFTLKEDLVGFSQIWTKKWKSPGAWMLLAGGLLAATEIILLLKLTGSQSEANTIEQLVRQHHSLSGKLSQVFQIGLSAMYAPQSAFRLLFHLGLIGVVILWRRKLIALRAASFHLILFSFALLAMVSEVLPIPGGHYIGGTFYYHPARAACIVYVGVWIVALSAFPLLESWMEAGARKIGIQRNLSRFIKGAFVLWAIQFHIMIWIKLPTILDRWDKEFHTPHWSSNQDLIQTIKQSTDSNAIIIARPFDVDILGPVTGRDSLFIYGDFISERSENEKNKVRWFESVVASLKQTLISPMNSENSCTSGMKESKASSFGRSVVVVLSEKDIEAKSLSSFEAGAKICRDVDYLGIKNEHAIFQITGL